MSYRQSDKKESAHGDLPTEGREAAQRAVTLLARVLADPSGSRESLEEFQHSVWLDPDQYQSETIGAILGELAYELDRFDPDPKHRREDPDLIGEDRACSLIRQAFETLEQNGITIPRKAK